MQGVGPMERQSIILINIAVAIEEEMRLESTSLKVVDKEEVEEQVEEAIKGQCS